MLIEIVNWEKYNPRNDYKSIPWLRLSSRLPREEKLFKATPETKWTYVSLLCLAAEENKNGVVSKNLEWICDAAKLPIESIEAILNELQQRGLIQFTTIAKRTPRVRQTNVPRSLRTNERNERNGDDGRTWPSADPLAKVFENLKAFPAYWSIFDTEKDRGVIADHMKRHSLTVADMERVTWELKNWVDGAKGEIKSPRGKLATFVGNFAERKAKNAPAVPRGSNYTVITDLSQLDD